MGVRTGSKSRFMYQIIRNLRAFTSSGIKPLKSACQFVEKQLGKGGIDINSNLINYCVSS